MKNKTYAHITKTERREIALLRGKRYSIREMSRMLNRSPNTISREIVQNSVKGDYDPLEAQHKAYVKRKYSKYQGMKVVEHKQLWDYVEEKMQDDWSPEEIAGRLKEVDRYLTYASRGAIYKFVYSVYGRSLERHLRYRGRKRKGTNSTKVAKLQNRIFIDQRPKIVDTRRRFGDWEGDFIVSGKNGKGILLVLHERKARYTLVRRILQPTIATVHQLLYELTGGYVISTLTLDNDIIFKKHEELSELLGVPIYFCHPYHSWEKGGVENTSKLIRQYIPKRSDISQYSDRYTAMVQDKLNNRPRKCLNYKTPLEVMEEHHQLKQEIRHIIQTLGINKKSPSVLLEG